MQYFWIANYTWLLLTLVQSAESLNQIQLLHRVVVRSFVYPTEISLLGGFRISRRLHQLD